MKTARLYSIHKQIFHESVNEARAVSAQDNLIPIQKVLMVGALFAEGNMRGEFNCLSRMDATYLCAIARILPKHGYSFSRTPDIRICNLKYDHDFLKQQEQTDLLVFAYVFFGMTNRTDPIFAQSPMATEPEAWHLAAQNAQPKLIVNIHGGSGRAEVPSKFFNRPPFSLENTHKDGMHYDVLKFS